jgi:drug/metabolite transporter (DMT)-like permease
MLLFGGCVIGLAPILVRLADAGPAASGFWRLLLAMPLLALLARPWAPEAAAEPGRGQGGFPKIVLLAGLFFAMDLSFWHYGIALTSVANATVLTNLTPVVVTAIAWLVFRERPGWLFLAAVVLAIAGASMMATAHGPAVVNAAAVNPSPVNGSAVNPFHLDLSASVHTAVNPPLGDALSLITALWYAAYLLAVGRARRSMGPVRVMFWSTLVGVPVMLAVALFMGERLFPGSRLGWAACVGLAAMHIAGQGSIAWALGRLPTATASMIVLVQPVVAAVLGWLLLSEPLGVWQTVGGLIALTGVVLSQWASARRQTLQPPAAPA